MSSGVACRAVVLREGREPSLTLSRLAVARSADPQIFFTRESRELREGFSLTSFRVRGGHFACR